MGEAPCIELQAHIKQHTLPWKMQEEASTQSEGTKKGFLDVEAET